MRMVVQIQIGQGGRAVEGRRHRRAQLAQPGIDAPRRLDFKGVSVAPHGLGVGEPARQIVCGDGGLILRARLHGVVEVLDRRQAGLGRLQHGDAGRDMGRGLHAALLRLAHSVEEELGLQGVVGDLDEVDAQGLQPVQGRIHVGLAAGLDHALPDRRDALDLGAGGEDARAVGRRRGVAPVQHLLREIARGVAHGDHAVDDIEGHQFGVFLDQGLASAEMNMHVPQTRHDIAVTEVRRPRRAIAAGLALRRHGDDVPAAHGHQLIGRRRPLLDIDHRDRGQQQVDRLDRAFNGGQRRRGAGGQQGDGGDDQKGAHEYSLYAGPRASQADQG
ncbi:hypothetical protein D3C87_1292860 [compost metagenome]